MYKAVPEMSGISMTGTARTAVKDFERNRSIRRSNQASSPKRKETPIAAPSA
jgi:hypothetical protein